MDDLKCNSLRCRKSLALEGSAVVTTCSHIFCIDCANALFSLPQICPACETALPDPDDVVQTSLNPHDSYKTSILAGLSPTIILDIAGRALNFYAYQIQQEAAFQALITKNTQERIAILEAQCNTVTREAHVEVNLLKEKLARTEKDLDLQKRRNHDLQETHKANAKAYQKLRLQYDKAKQRALFDGADTNGFQPQQQFGNAPGSAGPGTPAFQQNFVSGVGGRGTPRPGGGSGTVHGPFSSVARQQNVSGRGTGANGDSAMSWRPISTSTGGYGTSAEGPSKHFASTVGDGMAAKQNRTSASASRPRHDLRQPGVGGQQQFHQRLGSRNNGSTGSSTHSNDSRTVSAADGAGGGLPVHATFGIGVGGVAVGGGVQSWSNGGFVSGQAYAQHQRSAHAGGGFRPAGGTSSRAQP
ncbi:hypothetical protein JCM3774_002306 [Rhodotorula dairenensis]